MISHFIKQLKNICIIKTLSLILFIVICTFVFNGCYEPVTTELTPKIESATRTQSYVAYNKQHKQLFGELTKLQRNVSKKDMEELATLYQLGKNDPEKYETLMREKLISLISEKNLIRLQESMEQLQNSGNKLIDTKEYLALNEADKEQISIQLLGNLPTMSKLMKSNSIMTRSVSESECLADCAAARDEAIEAAAISALCGMAVGLGTCLLTGGWGSVFGLTSAFLAAHAGDMAIENARNTYDRCIKYC